MPNSKFPKSVAEFVKGEAVTGNRDPKTHVYKKNAKGFDNIRAEEAKRLAKALKLKFVDNLSVADIAKVLQVGEQVVRTMIDPFKIIMENPEKIRQFKKWEPQILDGIRMLALEGMHDKLTDPVMRKKTDLSRLTYTYGVLYDKQRLERGESTANVLSLSELVRAAHATDVTLIEPDRDSIIAEIAKEGEAVIEENKS